MLKSNKDKKNKSSSQKKFRLKYQKPKILLIDLPTECIDGVRSAGFNASAGTFGSPYKVTREDEYQPVVGEYSLPNYTEQEIIFVDLTAPETIDGPEGEKALPEWENDWWARCSWGKIDPRPRFMYRVRRYFDRIFNHGGLFVIFAQPRLPENLVWARVSGGELDIEREIPADIWSFLSNLSPDNLEIQIDSGEEIRVPDYDEPIFHFLQKNTKDAKYTATFSPTYRINKIWMPIAYSKFDKCVGGLIAAEQAKGRILILPQIAKKPQVILTLLCEVLPDICPHLFPHIEGIRWVERDEYELPSVLEYKTEKIEIQKRAKRELEELDKKIAEERDKLGFLHGIITKTGYDLVLDVQSCLELIGFKKIIDVDKQIQKQLTTAPKQEDLQVHDKSPALVLEVKGLAGLPRESDTIQVDKYVSRRMKEWNRIDVRGISIINHQRNFPALERDNKNVFTEQQIEDAKNHDITILTTWDLFLLIKGMLKWGWDPKAIQQLFYQSGRMPRIPTIYNPIGKIVKYWETPGVIGVQISKNILHKGERIGYVLPEGYLEENVLSLQVENQDVEEVVPEQLGGIRTIYRKELLRRGTIVCTVRKCE